MESVGRLADMSNLITELCTHFTKGLSHGEEFHSQSRLYLVIEQSPLYIGYMPSESTVPSDFEEIYSMTFFPNYFIPCQHFFLNQSQYI